MEERVRGLLSRLAEVEALLTTAELLGNPKAYCQLTQEHSYLSKVRHCWDRIQKLKTQVEEDRLLLQGELDAQLAALLREDLRTLEPMLAAVQGELEVLLVPPDPLDNRDVIVEVRAGTGGDEAALFVGDCVRMYQGFANQEGWKCEPLSASPSERGGFKEYVMALSGVNVCRYMRHEAGTHRVQRVPQTEAQGRIHTSAITVAVLPEPSEEEQQEIHERDLRIETYRASGAGGQHVNVTDSAVRITHLPTGTVVTCQEERSQHKNREKAMRLLSAKIVEEQRRKSHQELSSLRSVQVGSGDRSERIRTYNFPQNRVTDHRINYTVHNLPAVLAGSLIEFTTRLVAHFHEQQQFG